MNAFVRLVLRYFIFSSHERKFLPGITKLAALRSRPTLWGLGMGVQGGQSCWDSLILLVISASVAVKLIVDIC